MIYVPAVLLTAGIAILSLTESTHMPSVSLNDKAAHGAMYALLAVTWMIPVIKQRQTISNHFKPYLIICACTTAYGALLELLQHYCTMTRSGERLDVLADFLGALIGVLIVFVISRSRHHDISN